MVVLIFFMPSLCFHTFSNSFGHACIQLLNFTSWSARMPCLTDRLQEIFDLLRFEISSDFGLQSRPDVFDDVQIRRVGWPIDELKPFSLHPCLHLMFRRPIIIMKKPSHCCKKQLTVRAVWQGALSCWNEKFPLGNIRLVERSKFAPPRCRCSHLHWAFLQGYEIAHSEHRNATPYL